MNHVSKSLASLTTPAILLVVLAACGGDDSPTPVPSPTQTPIPAGADPPLLRQLTRLGGVLIDSQAKERMSDEAIAILDRARGTAHLSLGQRLDVARQEYGATVSHLVERAQARL